MHSKGLELPMNTLIVMAVALIVLVAVLGLFITGSKEPSEVTELQNRFRSECIQYVNAGCCIREPTNDACNDAKTIVPSAKDAIGSEDSARIKSACCTIG